MTMPLLDRYRARLRENWQVRRTYHAVLVARSVKQPWVFVADLARGRSEGTYRARRTGYRVTLRPRLDLQVAREQLARAGYVVPPEVQNVLGAWRPAKILDLGANIGLFTLSALARDAHVAVVAVEPDPGNLPLLERNVAQNGLADRVRVVARAAGTGPGMARFVAHRRELSRVVATGSEVDVEDEAATIDVEVVDAFDLAAEVAADLVKIDIEGSEWPLLRDPRFALLPARVVVMEWHAAGSGVDAPREEAERLLRAAGYAVVHAPHRVAEAGEIWAYRS